MQTGKLAVRVGSFPMRLPQALQRVAEWGVRSVELDGKLFQQSEASPGSSNSDTGLMSETGLRSFRKMLSDLELSVAAIRFHSRRGYATLDRLDARVDATKRMMHLAGRVGAPVVINSIGKIPENEEDSSYQTLVEVVDDLGRYGARVGAFFAAETGANSGACLDKLLTTTSDGYVAVALNPGQWVIEGHDVIESTKAIAHRTRCLLAIDGVTDLSVGRGIAVPLGQGIVDFAMLFGILEERGFDGSVIAGRHDSSPNEVADAIEYLRSLGLFESLAS
ncbi:MAG: sugar phosphate isomerase/epimerase family protein [Planctomycetota bacterium]